MFEEREIWNVDENADQLNQSLFGSIQSGHSVVTKKSKKNKKHSVTDIGSATDDLTHKKSVGNTSGLSGSPKKRKKKEAKIVSGQDELSGKGTLVSQQKGQTTDKTISLEAETTPPHKRMKHRKRKPKNKFAHLAKTNNPDGSDAKISPGLVSAASDSHGSSLNAKSDSGQPSSSKKKRKSLKNIESNGMERKSAISSMGESTVDSVLNSPKKKRKRNKKKSVTGGESPLKSVGGSQNILSKEKNVASLESGTKFVKVKSTQVSSTAGATSSSDISPESNIRKKKRNRKRKNKKSDEDGEISPKKQKMSLDVPNVPNVSSTNLKKSTSKKIKAETPDKSLKDFQSYAKEISIGKKSPHSPFDLAELRKRLSGGGHLEGAEVAKDMPSSGVSHKGKVKRHEVKKKRPRTLREKMMEQLNSARFRDINEQLYTCTGAEAYDLLNDDPSIFKVYHEGFTNQVNRWPINPVEKMIEYINSKGPNLVVADFGCGDAKIAQSVQNRVHSFDLVAVNQHITACEMSKVPLRHNCVDIGIFCLSLMGTNLVDYLHEANRIMRKGGVLLIAEVISRIKRVNIFIHQVEDLGFMLMHKDTSNKMFILFEFKKARDAPPKHRLEPIELLPCVYKKR